MSAVLETSPFFLRPMLKNDMDEIMAIELKSYVFPWTRQIFIDCLRAGYYCQVCEMHGYIVAYGIMSTGAAEAHVLNLCVSSERQGKGLGRQLLSHMLGVAEQKKIDTVFLEVRPSNSIALCLYDAMGFNQIGERKDYYPTKKGREDALILAKSLAKNIAKSFPA
ncbi:MAG: ribosomal protein S18-alanine N-acetyltransferase [Gammaproteobacteria bacterium]|nr:ribosomal protein S18-alanine N-acetyltransferase [Gammaproteobacteria bacterium]